MPFNSEAWENFVDILSRSPKGNHRPLEDKQNGSIVTTNPSEVKENQGQARVHLGTSRGDLNTYAIPPLELCFQFRYEESDSYSSAFHRYIRHLDGNEVEVDTTGYFGRTWGIGFWNYNWKYGEVASAYQDGIYPRVIKTVVNQLQRLEGTEKIHFVDLFGGDGEFVELLSGELEKDQYTYHIVDSCSPALATAREHFKDSKDVVVHRARILDPDRKVFTGIPQPNIVTAIGGICAQVVHRRDAYGITERIYEEMAEGGVFIATGFTGVLLNAADFSRIGFRVEQMTVPENVVSLDAPYQLYVLKK